MQKLIGYKKILILTSEFPPGPGGIGNHAFNLASHLTKNNIKVTVMVTSVNLTKQTEQINENSFEVLRIKSSVSLKYFNLIYLCFKYFLVNKKTDIIISGHLPVIIYGNIIKFFFNKSYGIIHGHEVLMGNNFIKYFTKRALENISVLIPVSNFSKKKITENLKHNKIKVIPNGFDHERFSGLVKKRKIDKDTLNLVTVGTISPRKGQHNVIKAIPTLKKKFKKVEYNIIGEKGNNSYLKELILKLNIEKNINFHGYLNDSELSKIMNRSSIFTMLSETQKNGDLEGFGIAILEANHFGLPVIGSKNCGIEDSVNDLFSGILVQKDSIKQFSIAVEEIYDNYDTYQVSAISWSKRFHWNNIIYHYLETIK